MPWWMVDAGGQLGLAMRLKYNMIPNTTLLLVECMDYFEWRVEMSGQVSDRGVDSLGSGR